MRKLGIFGGTFDPVHWGHLLIAETAKSQMDLEQVIWVPTRCPPHKQAAMFEHRVQMVQIALQDNPDFVISPFAANRHGSSYAIQTLSELQSLYPDTHWYWIIGLDAFQTLPRWYRRQELAAICDWLVAPRFVSVSAELDQKESVTGQIHLLEQVAQQLAAQSIAIRFSILDMPLVGVSASLIRQYCRSSRSIRYLVPEAVRIYIANQNLYLR